jgi:hypothetical protein
MYKIDDEFKYLEKKEQIVQDYINNRVLPQINWYDRHSVKYRKNYRFYMLISIIISALIPVLTYLTNTSNDNINYIMKLLIIIAGGATAVITSIISLNKYNELGVQYRVNCEMLKSALHRFITNSDEFLIDNNTEGVKVFKKFVSITENYLIEEYKKAVDITPVKKTI